MNRAKSRSTPEFVRAVEGLAAYLVVGRRQDLLPDGHAVQQGCAIESCLVELVLSARARRKVLRNVHREQGPQARRFRGFERVMQFDRANYDIGNAPESKEIS